MVIYATDLSIYCVCGGGGPIYDENDVDNNSCNNDRDDGACLSFAEWYPSLWGRCGRWSRCTRLQRCFCIPWPPLVWCWVCSPRGSPPPWRVPRGTCACRAPWSSSWSQCSRSPRTTCPNPSHGSLNKTQLKNRQSASIVCFCVLFEYLLARKFTSSKGCLLWNLHRCHGWAYMKKKTIVCWFCSVNVWPRMNLGKYSVAYQASSIHKWQYFFQINWCPVLDVRERQRWAPWNFLTVCAKISAEIFLMMCSVYVYSAANGSNRMDCFCFGTLGHLVCKSALFYTPSKFLRWYGILAC